ncbi:unnamed protein product [Echinostoma caproni]|uniref:Dentin sialophosphoprotein-like n=1 Tax=Echinostoma caproni TaxID=27848 RepID=A0A183AJR6_9TREM|nr:unnamed protein product [Echinostoma caproni]
MQLLSQAERNVLYNQKARKVSESHYENFTQSEESKKSARRREIDRKNTGCDSSDKKNTYTSALVFSTENPIKEVLIESTADRKISKRLICRSRLCNTILTAENIKSRAALTAELEKKCLSRPKFSNAQAETMVTVTNVEDRNADRTVTDNVLFPNKKHSIVSNESPCVVRFMYLGASKFDSEQLKKSSSKSDSQLSRNPRSHMFDGDTKTARLITVIQQPNGGNTITVFKGHLQPGDSEVVKDRQTASSEHFSKFDDLSANVLSSKTNLMDTDREKSIRADSLSTEFKPICTNLNRRIVKSTTWECFTPANAEMQMNLDQVDERVPECQSGKVLHYGIEQMTEGHLSQGLRPFADSTTHTPILSDVDNHRSPSTEIEPSNDCTAERYQDDFEEELDDNDDEEEEEVNLFPEHEMETEYRSLEQHLDMKDSGETHSLDNRSSKRRKLS